MSLADDLAAPGAHNIPELLGGAAVVALVPATDELRLAARAAWQFARDLAAGGRRVALVDCFVDDPQLDGGASAERDGIVDAFEYGASLSRIAQPQADPNLYFIPAGTFAPDPVALMRHPRWRRLAAGFRHEQAVMLLFVSPACLGAIAPTLDGLVALAPGGGTAGLAATPEIQAIVDRGVRLLATVTESEGAERVAEEPGLPDEEGATPAEAAETAPAPPPRAQGPEPKVTERRPSPPPPAPAAARPLRPPRPSPPPRASRSTRPLRPLRPPRPSPTRPAPLAALLPHPPRRHVARPWLIVLALVALAAAALTLFGPRLGLGDLGLALLRKAAPASPESAAAPVVPAYRRLAPHAVDSLPFVVQVSAWTSLTFALDAADALEGRGIPPIISPVRLGSRVWYRLYVGPVASAEAADSLLAAARAAGFDRPRTATPLEAPLSVELKHVATPGAARAERARLRTAGIAAFVLGQADGSYRLYAGAFATPEQAAYFDSLVTSTGSAGPLGPRVGFQP